MADMIVPPRDGDEELENIIAEEISKNDDLPEYVKGSSLADLMSRFGTAEEDDAVRTSDGTDYSEGTKKGILNKKPKRGTVETVYPDFAPLEDIETKTESELAKVFDSTRSEYDSTVVNFEDLKIDTPETPENPVEEKKQETAEKAPQEPPKRKRGRPRKNPLPEEQTEKKEDNKASDNAPQEPPKRKRGRPRKNPLPEEKAEEKPQEIAEPEPEKFNTHTKVVFVDENLDDGIKRNSDTELEALFTEKPHERRAKLWSRRKK